MNPRQHQARLRKAVWERDNGVCQDCGVNLNELKEQLVAGELSWEWAESHGWNRKQPWLGEAHHRTPVRAGGGADESRTFEQEVADCVLVCIPCHRKLEREDREDKVRAAKLRVARKEFNDAIETVREHAAISIQELRRLGVLHGGNAQKFRRMVERDEVPGLTVTRAVPAVFRSTL